MEMTIKKWGNSLATRIPKAIVDSVGLEIDQEVVIEAVDGKIVITDPVYKNKTVFMGPSRYNGDVPLQFEDLPEIDLVVISHNHYDHFNTCGNALTQGR